MTFRDLYIICFAAASVIHGAQTVLAAKLVHNRAGCERTEAIDGVVIGVTTFLWQFGNFLAAASSANSITQGPTAAFHVRIFMIGSILRDGALACFPLLFSYMCLHIPEVRGSRLWLRIGRSLRYPLLPWTAMILGTVVLEDAGIPLHLLSPSLVRVTLYLMLLYFAIFARTSAAYRTDAEASGIATLVRAHKVSLIASVFAVGTFVLMLTGYWHVRIPFFSFIELAAMLSSVPFTVSIAYRQFQFPFMDAFVREVVSGVILLAALLIVLKIGTIPLWVSACAIGLAYAKGPLTRWVERTLMGHQESAEQQEERIGNAIRALTRLDEFGPRISEILANEVDAEWADIGSAPRAGADHRFEIAGSGLSLFVGPRVGGRRYMSRELRVLRSASLQLAAHHHQLNQHELRELTARAQMRALQAQINPHFLFNTLNVLANLIHSNPEKAERLTEELADIFRYALESTRVDSVALDDELRFLESYLEIEKARFEERLSYLFDVDVQLRSMRIPPMILQPLVENAVRHGIAPKVEGGEVRISARMGDDHALIVVEDTGMGYQSVSRHRGAGIGLTNVRERLQHLYGDTGTLKLEMGRSGGTRAVLSLPQFAGVHS